MPKLHCTELRIVADLWIYRTASQWRIQEVATGGCPLLLLTGCIFISRRTLCLKSAFVRVELEKKLWGGSTAPPKPLQLSAAILKYWIRQCSIFYNKLFNASSQKSTFLNFIQQNSQHFDMSKFFYSLLYTT